MCSQLHVQLSENERVVRTPTPNRWERNWFQVHLGKFKDWGGQDTWWWTPAGALLRNGLTPQFCFAFLCLLQVCVLEPLTSISFHSLLVVARETFHDFLSLPSASISFFQDFQVAFTILVHVLSLCILMTFRLCAMGQEPWVREQTPWIEHQREAFLTQVYYLSNGVQDYWIGKI